MVSIENATKKPKKLGRPVTDTEAVNVRLPRELLVRIDNWRARQRPILSRPKAILIFVEVALDCRDP
jgi:hypothetical protein